MDTKFCGNCQQHRPVADMKKVRTGNGVVRWKCKYCGPKIRPGRKPRKRSDIYEPPAEWENLEYLQQCGYGK